MNTLLLDRCNRMFEDIHLCNELEPSIFLVFARDYELDDVIHIFQEAGYYFIDARELDYSPRTKNDLIAKSIGLDKHSKILLRIDENLPDWIYLMIKHVDYGIFNCNADYSSSDKAKYLSLTGKEIVLIITQSSTKKLEGWKVINTFKYNLL